MNTWIIESIAGVVMGVYAGETKRAAFMAMLEEAGEASSYGDTYPGPGTEADWVISRYEGTLWIHDSGRGTEEIKAGVEAAHRVFKSRGVSPRDAWEAARAHADGRGRLRSEHLLSVWEEAEAAALRACDAGEHAVLVVEG
jgi:hypothetical protein